MHEKISKLADKQAVIPSLSENTFLRYAHFIVLYLAQGIPEGMLLYGIPAWMAINGKTVAEIGSFVAAVGLPWSFKIVVAPMMDRFTYLPMGRKRPWVLFGQLGLIVSFILMAFVPDPLNNLSLFMAAGFCVSFFGSFQDVATDGMAVDIVPVNEQARANGFMWGSKIVGISASLALGTWLLNQYSFSMSVLSLSVCVGLIMLAPLLLRERAGEKLLPWTKGEVSPETEKMKLENWSLIFKSLYKVFSLRNSLLVAFVGFISQAGFNFIATLLPVFTVTELEWTNPSFEFVTDNFANSVSQSQRCMTPAFGDLTGDGNADMVVGFFDGTLQLYTNTLGNFVFTASNYQAVDVGNNNVPFLFDINQDGLTDMICGDAFGKLSYFENTGTLTAPVFTLINSYWGAVNVTDSLMQFYGNSYPFIQINNGALELLLAHGADIFTSMETLPETLAEHLL